MSSLKMMARKEKNVKNNAGKATTVIRSTTELAAYLNLSRWTISRVINGHSGFSKETVERVKAAMKEFDFQPNPLAAALKGRTNDTVGICTTRLAGFDRKIAVIQNLLAAFGKRINIEVTNGEAELERERIHHLLHLNVDGIIFAGTVFRDNLKTAESLVDRGIPVVMIDDSVVELPFTKVTVNRTHAVLLSIEHLFQHGHRRFALMGIDRATDFVGYTRIKGVREAARRLNLSFKSDFVFLNEAPENFPNGYAHGEALGEMFLRERDRPTAIVASSDEVAIGAMSRLKKAGLVIPADVSIVGFFNINASRYVEPALTTIDPRLELEASTAVHLLYEQVEGKISRSGSLTTLIEPLLIERESVAAPPAAIRLKSAPR